MSEDMENMEEISDIDGILCSECGEIPEIKKVHTDNSKIEYNCKKCGIKEVLIDDYYDELFQKDYFKKCELCFRKGIYNNKFYKCSNSEKYLCEFCKNNFDTQNEYKEEKEKKDHYYYNRCSKCKNKNADKNNYYYCFDCEKNICQNCKNSHCGEHDCIEEKEKNKKCLKHNKGFKYFCLQCQLNFCKECKGNHQNHFYVEIEKDNESENVNENEKKEIEEKLKKVLDDHRPIVIKINKELSNLVEFNETILKYTENIKKNDFYFQSIENIAKSLKEGNERNSNDIKCLLNGFIKDIENSMNAINSLVDKEILLERSDKFLHLNNRNLGNEEFKYISQIRFNQLKEIDLSENNIEDIEPFEKMSLPFLEFLNLSGNDIKKIEPIIKLNAINLEYIFLQRNKIEDLNPLLKSDFKKLKLLRIEDSKIEEENEEKKNERDKILAKIKEVIPKERFFFNSMEEHIKQFKKKYNLEEKIDISGDSESIDLYDKKGGQEMLKDLFLIITSKSINKIKKLILRNNEIKDPSLLKRVNFGRLEVLDLAVNDIEKLDFLLEMKAQKLKYLYVDNNKFEYDGVFPILNANFPNLEVVSLNKNEYKSEVMAKTPGYTALKNKKNKKNKKLVIQLEEDKKLNDELNKDSKNGNQSNATNPNANNNAIGENHNANNNIIGGNSNSNNNPIEENLNANNN